MPSDPLSLALLALVAISLAIAVGSTWVSVLARRGLHGRRCPAGSPVRAPPAGPVDRLGERPATTRSAP